MKLIVRCSICGKTLNRYKSHIKSKYSFCCIEHQSLGRSLGLIESGRKGTGCSDLIKYYKQKYYKYRKWDKDKGFKIPDYSVWELVERLLHGKCYYCGTNKKLGLDRIDNSKGHFKNNTVVCCELCNMTRGNRFTVEEMKLVGKTIKDIRRLRNDK